MWATCKCRPGCVRARECPAAGNESHIKFIRNFKSKWKVTAVSQLSRRCRRSPSPVRALGIYPSSALYTHPLYVILYVRSWDLLTHFVPFLVSLCSYQDILHIPTALTQFSTSLGPIVDGHVIPNQPYKVMGHYTEHFSRFVKQFPPHLNPHSHPHRNAFPLT